MGDDIESIIARLRRSEAFRGLIGRSPQFTSVVGRLGLIADSDATVLVEGETGTGKELIARALHYLSARAAHPFVPINCAAVPDSLFENELFGHQRGAFTDAHVDRMGLLQAAHHGTLCLDEVGSMSPRNQGVLLRVLQDGSFRVLGSTRESATNARFVALSNVPLADTVREGTFRADLYYRLSVLTVTLPPLRARRDDILPLALHFIDKHARPGRPVRGLSPRAEALLREFDWPGNVRQLESVIVRALHLCTPPTIDVPDLELVAGASRAESVSAPGGGTLRVLKRQAIEAFERNYLTTLMQACGGNVSAAARHAGKDRRDLARLLKKYGLTPGTAVN